MSVGPGTKLGPYEITARLGAGGMGEVYRARDTRLDRSVAIKVLPPRIAGEEQARARFEREARAISALNHPNICTLFDVGSENGISYLVMELIEGQTLAELLARGPLPLDDALHYSIEIATALDRAHRQGIVHRDLKPGNIMITKSGVKLLDFGLARLDGRSDVTPDAPTAANPITAEGVIVGTLQYMSPEQLQGGQTDARTDIFSFGCILYEMVSGRRAFSGSNQASIIAAIMSAQPAPLTGLAPIPPHFDRIVKKCLIKTPDDRWQNAGDLATELRWIAEAPQERLDAPGKQKRVLVPWIAAAIAAAAALALLFRHGPAEPARVTRLSIPIDADRLRYSGLLHKNTAVSPDGQWLVYSGWKDEKPSLWLRNLSSSTAAAPIPNTEGGADPFWSPDSKNVAFFAGSKLKRVGINGDGLASLCEYTQGATISGAWGAAGTILFSELGGADGLYHVPAAGGRPEKMSLSSVRPGGAPFAPAFIDGDRFVYCDVTTGANIRVHVHSLRSGEDRDLGPTESRVEVVDGVMLSTRQGALVAQRVDANLQRVGTPVVISPSVFNYRSLGLAEFSAAHGVLVYATPETDAHATWFDRSGTIVGTIGPTGVRSARISRDGRHIAMSAVDWTSGTDDLWIADIAHGSSTRLTNTPWTEGSAVLSPDGQSVAYHAEPDAAPHLFIQSLRGGAPEVVTRPRGVQYLSDWSPDGQSLLFREFNPKTRGDLWTVAARPGSEPVPLLRTPFDEFYGRISPDGKYFAYNSDASGRDEVYVAAFASPSDAVQVSNGGGQRAAWSGDGKQLFFDTNDKRVFVCDIQTAPRLDAGTPRYLFQGTGDWPDFDVTPDGSRFLIVRRLSGPDTRPLSVVLNWQQLLDQPAQ